MVAVSSVQLATLQAKSGIQQTQEDQEDPEAMISWEVPL